MEAITIMTAMIGPTKRSVEAIAAKQKTANAYPDEKKILIGMAFLETL